MKKRFMIFLSSVVFLAGCMNEFKFRADDTNSGNAAAPGNEITRNPDGNTDVGNPKPEDPVIVDPDSGALFPVAYKKGECTKDPLNVVSCMTCQIDQRPLPAPLSTKASQLLKIMELGCAIANKSDPQNYMAPSRTEILKYLNQATYKMYPDSTMTVRQQQNISKWMAGDKKNLERLFGGLWYNPPYSDDFETYFGLEPREARHMFCYEAPEASFSIGSVSDLYSIEYFRCVQEGGFSCRERADYVKGNIYRRQLIAAIEKSLVDPVNDQEMVPVNKCHWESMSGYYNLEMENKLIEWKNTGYELAVSFEKAPVRCEPLTTTSISFGTKVTVGAKKCEDFIRSYSNPNTSL
tara:strand:- start:9479 stop:10531 length:1053 start_codon:yes stop_codon:yes gene_type:complete